MSNRLGGDCPSAFSDVDDHSGLVIVAWFDLRKGSSLSCGLRESQRGCIPAFRQSVNTLFRGKVTSEGEAPH